MDATDAGTAVVTTDGPLLAVETEAEGKDTDPDARDDGAGLNTSNDSIDQGEKKKTQQRWSAKWYETNKLNLQATIDEASRVDADILAFSAIEADDKAAQKQRGQATAKLVRLRKKATQLSNEKVALAARVADLEDAKLIHEATEAKKKLISKAPEFTDKQVMKLMQLYYEVFNEYFEGTSSTNVKVWESLAAAFNAWCQGELEYGEWLPEQLQRKWNVELQHYHELSRKLASDSGAERGDQAREEYTIQHWRKSFEYFQKYEVHLKAFSVPPLLMGAGKITMSSAATAVPLRIGGKGGDSKYRGLAREETDKKQERNRTIDREENKRHRTHNRTLIAQQAAGDHRSADERQAKMQDFIAKQTQQELESKAAMHSQLINTLNKMIPPSSTAAEIEDAKLLAKIRELCDLSERLQSLDASNVAYPFFQRQVHVLTAEVQRLQDAQSQRTSNPGVQSEASSSAAQFRFPIPFSD
jgi:hypothetical protein